MNLHVSSLVKTLRLSHCASILLFAASASYAQGDVFQYPEIQEDRPGGVTITPLVGQFFLDSERNLDDDTAAGIALGYRFSEPYAVEFVYLGGDATSSTGGASGDIKQYRLEALYDVAQYGAWTPYLAVGAANTEYGNAAIDDEGAMTLGAGTHYHFNERIALRADARYLKGVDNNKGADVVLALGINFFLGNVAKKAAPVEPVAVLEPKKPTFIELCTEAGGAVNVDGACVKQRLKTGRVTLNVPFELNSDQVSADYLSEVKKLADFMSAHPTANVVIEGHTDALGSDEYNQQLSQRRVNEVARLVIDNYGINADRISAVGYGESQPITSNSTAESRAKNRRVMASIRVELEEVIQLDIK